MIAYQIKANGVWTGGTMTVSSSEGLMSGWARAPAPPALTAGQCAVFAGDRWLVADSEPTLSAPPVTPGTSLTAVYSDLADSSKGAALVAFRHPASGSVPRSVADKQRESISVTDFGAVADSDGTTGVGTDNLAAFQAAAAAAALFQRSLKIPAAPAGRFYRIDFTGATVAAPKIACNFSDQHRMFVYGEGDGSAIFMDGINTTYLNAQPSEGGAGHDIATVFLFDRCTGGGVRDVFCRGLYTKGVDPDLVVPRPRAKFCGTDSGQNLVFMNVNGEKIPGNVVNIRGFSGIARRCKTIGSFASGCAENGFNYMGGTEDCVFSSNVSINNGFQGFESGTNGLVCTSNVCNGNKNGISQVGRNGTISGNKCEANTYSNIHLQYNNAKFDGRNNAITSNTLRGAEVGVLADANINGASINNNTLEYCKEGIKASTGTTAFSIQSNVIRGFTCALNLALGGGHIAQGNIAIPYADWAAGTVYAVWDRCVNGANVYEATTAATSGATAPTHTSGSASDGAVTWAWLGSHFGVSLAGSSNLSVKNNSLAGVISIGSASGLAFSGNKGAETEAYGSYTVPSGTTTVTISHGLISTPTVIRCSSKSDLGALYSPTANSTSFTVQRPGAVSFAAGDIIYWEARVA